MQTILSRITWFVVLFLLQVLVFNHVHIFGFATPMPYVYFLILLPSDTPHWLYVAVGFAMGLAIDLFTNTPGMAAGSLCLTGLLTPWLVAINSPKEHDDDNAIVPSRRTLEWGGFLRLTVIAALVHCAAFFTLEAFSFFDWHVLLINIAGSTLLTTLFIVAMELVRGK